MQKTKIAWGDGTSDYLYLSYESFNGNQSVSITSDLNKEVSSRSKTINVKTSSDGIVKAKIIITQTTDGIGIMMIGSTFAIPFLTKSVNSEEKSIQSEDNSLYGIIKNALFK